MGEPEIRFSAKILRKQTDLPRYIIVKAEHVGARSKAFQASVRINNSPAFKRMIRPWGKGSDAFFFNLTQPHCKKAGVETGDACDVSIEPNS